MGEGLTPAVLEHEELLRPEVAHRTPERDVEPLPVMSTPAIFGVQLTMLARKTDAGLGKLKGLVVSGAQTAVSAEIMALLREVHS